MYSCSKVAEFKQFYNSCIAVPFGFLHDWSLLIIFRIIYTPGIVPNNRWVHARLHFNLFFNRKGKHDLNKHSDGTTAVFFLSNLDKADSVYVLLH